MHLIRTNNSIYWLGTLLAASAWAMPSNRLTIAVALMSLLLVAVGVAIRHVGWGGGVRSLRHFVAPALAVALAVAAVARVVA